MSKSKRSKMKRKLELGYTIFTQACLRKTIQYTNITYITCFCPRFRPREIRFLTNPEENMNFPFLLPRLAFVGIYF